MNNRTLKLFHEIMKKGYIDRNDNSSLWNYTEDADARDELDQMGRELGFEIYQAQNRIYLVPTQDNDLFLKNNSDFKVDIKGTSDVRARDLYLLNYLAMYILFIFFKGEGNEICVRDFITKEELIKDFSEHCEKVTQKGVDGEDKKEDYSENFCMLASDWLGKLEGDVNSRKSAERYGMVNRLIAKFKADELFIEDESDGRIWPTKKTKDLMPLVLRKDRVQDINRLIEEAGYATDK